MGSRTTVTVTQGYSVTNGLTVGAGLDYTFVKDVLKGALKIDYSHSWTTTYQAAMAYEVTPGYSGTIVTKPTVTRRSGRILKGCIGAQVSAVIPSSLFSLGRYNLIPVYSRPLRAASRQLLTRRASAVVSLGSRETSASARGRLLMEPLLLVATAAVTSSRAFRNSLLRFEGWSVMDPLICALALENGSILRTFNTGSACHLYFVLVDH